MGEVLQFEPKEIILCGCGLQVFPRLPGNNPAFLGYQHGQKGQPDKCQRTLRTGYKDQVY